MADKTRRSTNYDCPTNVPTWKNIPISSLRPLRPPPKWDSPPCLPSPIRAADFSPTHRLETHIIPAAFPPAPTAPFPQFLESAKGETKHARRERAHACTRVLADAKQQLSWDDKEDDRVLSTVVNRFARIEKACGKPGATLLLTHPNGMHKEVWEPMLKSLLGFSENPEATFLIEEVWALDSAQHGDSRLLNEGKLGVTFDWHDNARDILNFVTHYLPETFDPAALPTHLGRIPDEIAASRCGFGFSNRRVVAVGHSFGGCSTALAAVESPKLFDSIIFIEPLIGRFSSDHINKAFGVIPGVFAKRSAWSSRDEARRDFQSLSFFSTWHSEVLEAHIQYGLTESTSGGVCLKTPAILEAAVFTDFNAPIEAWQMLPQIDERIALRWLMSGTTNALTGGDADTAETVWRRPSNSSNVRVPGVGHLVAQEAPVEVAQKIYQFLDEKYSTSDNSRAKL